jgi:triosephosphate isomerase
LEAIVARRPYVAGNWKMNMDRAGAVALAEEVAAGAAELTGTVDVGMFPAFVHVDAVSRALAGAGSKVILGAQDCYPGEHGAFTGEVSAPMLKDVGCASVLTGHSERRHVIGEGDEIVNRKTLAALGAGMQCILCVGETIEQRRAGETDAVNERQVRAGLAGVTPEMVARLTIAYEPVWAIGTGETATPDDAQDAQEKIRRVLADVLGADAAAAMRIQYGGSMKPANAADLLACPDIDGGLIGGASLKAESFLAIVRAGLGK